ncbi:n-terminal glutamine amidohydrolase [Nannochloropsis oceanica]
MPSHAFQRQHQHQHQHQLQQQEQRESPQPPQEASHLPPALSLPRAAFVYTRCYCEENVYLLLAKLQTLLISSSSGSPGQLSALFISNKIKTCPVWGQLAAGEDGSKNVERKDEREYKETGHKEHFDGDDNDDNEERERSPVLWDYHVVALLETGDSAAFIYDLDTRLEPFPCPASEYVARAFRPDIPMKEEYRQRFRLVPFVPIFRDSFACDRSHMRRPDGSWNAPPPAYPPIRGSRAASPMTLPLFWNVDDQGEERIGGGRGGELGEILSLADLQARVGAGRGGEDVLYQRR